MKPLEPIICTETKCECEPVMSPKIYQLENREKIHPKETCSVETQTYETCILKVNARKNVMDDVIKKFGRLNCSDDSGVNHWKVSIPSLVLSAISQLDTKFYEAVKHICSAKVIGLAAEGMTLEHLGKPSLLQIDTKEKVYVFDLLSKPNEFFKEGLAGILENRNILKVMHDCRPLGDNLFHKFNIKLTNVFDTQIADMYHFEMMLKRKRRCLRNLSATLVSYLQLDLSAVKFCQVQFNLEEIYPEIWQQRPLDRYLIHIAVSNVVYLRSLREALLRKIEEMVLNGGNLYLTSVRTSMLPRKKELPTPEIRGANDEDFDDSGFKIEAVKILDPYMNFSKDYWDAVHEPKVYETDAERIADTPKIKLKNDSEIVMDAILSSNDQDLFKLFGCKDVKMPDEIKILRRAVTRYPYLTSSTEQALYEKSCNEMDKSISNNDLSIECEKKQSKDEDFDSPEAAPLVLDEDDSRKMENGIGSSDESTIARISSAGSSVEASARRVRFSDLPLITYYTNDNDHFEKFLNNLIPTVN